MVTWRWLNGRGFYTGGRIIVQDDAHYRPEGFCGLAVFILKTHYPSGRNWVNISSSSGFASLVQRRAQDVLHV